MCLDYLIINTAQTLNLKPLLTFDLSTPLAHICLFFCCCLSFGSLNAQIEPEKSAADSIEIIFEPPAGNYPGPIVPVTLYAPGADAIFYTTDGTTPSQRSNHYLGPIQLDETTVLRVVAYRHGEASPLHGSTYFINEPATDLPVVSIGVKPSLLFHPDRGIFMQGSKALDSLWNKPGANFWTRREFPVHIEIFENDGRTVYNSLSGLRLFGGMSRLFPQKSMAIVARKRYGKSRIKHRIFGDAGPKSFKYLVLRNSGSDFGKSHFRDGLMTSLVRDWDMETQAFRPAHVYLNGEYWGIYNIREKINRYFLKSHFPEIDKDSVDIIEHYLTRKKGTKRNYQQLLRILRRYDPQDPAVWADIQTRMDVDNFMALQIAQIYFDNQDAGGNIRYWRPQAEDGRWRWILYDTDWGFGLHDDKAYRNNSLAFHTKPNGPSWPNPPWSTFILRKLLENEFFRQKFVNRFADHLNSSFAPDLVVARIDSMQDIYQSEIYRHHARWRLTNSNWHEQVDRMKEFAQKRPDYLRDYLARAFNTGPQRDFSLTVSKGGQVLMNDQKRVRTEGLEGVYFANYAIKVRAIPDYGHRFVRWVGLPPELNDLSREIYLDLELDRPYEIHAQFESFKDPLREHIVINEVCAKNNKTGDWLEIHNRSRKGINLDGWILTDLKNEYRLPNIDLGPRDYLVICRDADRFRSIFPTAYNVIGGLPFGINKRKESLALYSHLGAAVDSVSYEIPPMDTAFSLSLLLPDLDNGDIENWEIRLGDGTPNRPNPYYVSSYVRQEQHDWLRIGLAIGVLVLGIFLLRLRK